MVVMVVVVLLFGRETGEGGGGGNSLPALSSPSQFSGGEKVDCSVLV